MEIVIKGEPKEIAALVVAAQERRDLEFNGDAVLRAIKRHREVQGQD